MSSWEHPDFLLSQARARYLLEEHVDLEAHDGRARDLHAASIFGRSSAGSTFAMGACSSPGRWPMHVRRAQGEPTIRCSATLCRVFAEPGRSSLVQESIASVFPFF